MEIMEIDEENVEEFSPLIDEDLADDIQRVFFRGIGVKDDDDVPVGALVYELYESESEEDTKSLIRLFKAEDEEVGRLLMEEYAEFVKEDDIVESFYEVEDEAVAKKLKRFGFSLDSREGVEINFNVEYLSGLPIVNHLKNPSYIMSLKDISVLQFRSVIKECLFKGRKGLLEDLAYLPMKWFDMEVSACSVSDDKVDGMLLIRKTPSDMLYVLLYVAFGHRPEQKLYQMLLYSARMIVEHYPPETRIIINRYHENVRNLTQKIFPDQNGNKVYYGIRKEQ